MESVVSGRTTHSSIEDLRLLTVTRSCGQLQSEIFHMMQVNELINREDPQSFLSMQRTLNLYLDMINQQCSSSQKQKTEVIAR